MMLRLMLLAMSIIILQLKTMAQMTTDSQEAHEIGKEKESNWLPAPADNAWNITMRLYAPQRAAIVLDRTGNTSSASIPLALVDAVEGGRVESGDLVLLTGFGAGMTWGSALLRWEEEHR